MIDILNLQENKVTTDLLAYPMVIMSEKSGDGKTDSLNRILTSMSPKGKKPLFLMFEDRYQHIPNIMAIRIHNMAELEQVKAQLKNPKAKELYSCLVIDTVDKVDSMLEKYVATNRQVEITGDLQFGKGNKCIKNALWFIDELRNDGWKVNFCCQSLKNENILTHVVTYEPSLNKETWKKVSHDAYLIGMLTKDPKSDERFITFKATQSYVSLKDSLGMPDKVKVSEFKDVIDKVIHSIKGATFTDEDTINGNKVEEVDFKSVIDRGNLLGGLLAQKGKKEMDEAFNILRTHIGIKDEKTNEPMMFSDLVESQKDLAQVIVLKLEDLCKKHGIVIP